MEKSQVIKMVGTEGSADYVVYARRGETLLGFKYLGLQAAYELGVTMLGIRLRAAPMSSVQMGAEVPLPQAGWEETVGMPSDIFPDIPWSKISFERASIELVVHIHGLPNQEDAEKALKSDKFLTTMAATILAAAPEKYRILPEDDVKKLLLHDIVGELATFKPEESAAVTAPAAPNADISEESGKLVPVGQSLLLKNMKKKLTEQNPDAMDAIAEKLSTIDDDAYETDNLDEDDFGNEHDDD